MKYLVKFFVITFVLLSSTYVAAQEKVVFLDMKQVLNTSKAGKGAQDYLQKVFKEGQKKYSAEEAILKEEEGDLLSKKTILSKDEYKKSADILREKVIKHQNSKRKSLEDITSKRTKARTDLIKKLTPIIENYTKEKGILLIIDKKDVIAGNPELDITNLIITKLNKELPSLNLK
mgnify:CR=1 FL=1|tara:strand:+ start:215 stop:739 length:525 start_codon:yes stop_codon:yes gene_type:complete